MKNTKAVTSQPKGQLSDKAKALERESNITLVSTSVAILSFFILLYVHTAITTNFVAAVKFINVLEIVLLTSAVATAVVAIWKKKTFLFEYTAFCAVLAIGYYLLKNGASGIPFIFSESNGTFTVSPFAMKLAAILRTNHVIYALWAINVIYCVTTIVLHTVKYSKIKNSGKQS